MKKQNRNRFRLKLFLVLAVVLVLAALFSRQLCPYDPDLQDLTEAMKPPGLSHPFGTDRYGRDLLSRVLVGGRTSIFSALFLVLVTAMTGTVVGMTAGWAGGILDTLLMRLTDLFLAFPGLVFALAVAGVLGGGLLGFPLGAGPLDGGDHRQQDAQDHQDPQQEEQRLLLLCSIHAHMLLRHSFRRCIQRTKP